MGPAAALLVAQVAKAGFDAFQDHQQAKSDQRVAEYNSAVASMNARQTGLETNAAEEARRRQMRKELGQAYTTYAQSGGGVDSGMLKQASAEAELDALNIRYEGNTRREAFKAEEEMAAYEARVAKRRAKGAVVSGLAGTAAAALGAREENRRAGAQDRITTEIGRSQRPRGPIVTGKTNRAPISAVARARQAKGY